VGSCAGKRCAKLYIYAHSSIYLSISISICILYVFTYMYIYIHTHALYIYIDVYQCIYIIYIYIYVYITSWTRSEHAAGSSGERCSVRLSNSQDVSLIQRVLMTLVLRLLMNGGFSFDSANCVF